MQNTKTTVYAFRMTDEEKALVDKKLQALSKRFNLKLTFTSFVKWMLLNGNV